MGKIKKMEAIIKEAINKNLKTIKIEDNNFVAPGERIYLSNGKKYGVINAGFNRWVLIDLFRNLESQIATETKIQALYWVNEYEANQSKYENDTEAFENNEFRATFGEYAYNNRYFKK